MNKFWICGALASLVFASCTTGNTAQGISRSDFLTFKGEWKISDIQYDASKFKVKPFDEGADAKCWIGSTWKLIPNNWSGTYILHGGEECPAVSQSIKFDIVNGNSFVFKKIASGTKARNNIEGYALDLVSRTENNFSLKQNVYSGGQNVEIVYHFQKISK